ncbi:MAG TPA: hypothetical protein VK922_00390 [Gemmatimonadaceae bacterium]|nr:hypothetical protein [Gemmatimonadaceae bacterium]
MLKHILFMSAFAVAVAASPAEAQERRTCAWNDAECIRREGQQQPRTGADERSCKWNDAECIRREVERERREESERRDRDRVYDRDRNDRRDRDWERERNRRADAVCVERNRRGECARWERRGTRNPYMRASRFPNMASALAMRNGRGIPGDARPWVGSGPVRVELQNRDRDRVPERATIRILGTNETQVWIDRNNDGRADRILFYRNGRLVHDLK